MSLGEVGADERCAGRRGRPWAPDRSCLRGAVGWLSAAARLSVPAESRRPVPALDWHLDQSTVGKNTVGKNTVDQST